MILFILFYSVYWINKFLSLLARMFQNEQVGPLPAPYGFPYFSLVFRMEGGVDWRFYLIVLEYI